MVDNSADAIYQVLSGEGADEILGGYLYFSAAPNTQEFFEETRDKCKLTAVTYT